MHLRVLVVEDDFASLKLIGDILASADIQVLGLSDGWEAAALIEKDRFDGVFLDLTMPGVDGLELIKRIRRSPANPTTPIIVITARTDRQAMKEVFASGAQFYLPK